MGCRRVGALSREEKEWKRAGDGLCSGPGVNSCCRRVERDSPSLERGTGAVGTPLQGWGAVGWVEAKGQLRPAGSSPSVSQIQPLWQH